MKYRPQWPTKYMRSLTVSPRTSIYSMMPFYLTVWDIQVKTLNHEIKVTVTYKKYEVIRSVELNKYPKCDAFLLDRARHIRQNPWTMEYRSQWPTNSTRSLTVSCWTCIQSMMHSYLIGSVTQGKITGPWYIGHRDLQERGGQSQCETEQVHKVWCLSTRYSKRYKANHWTMKYRSQWPTKIWGH